MTDDILVPEISTRELGRLVSFYCKRVKFHSAIDQKGIIRQLQRLVAKGVTPEMLQIAVENYASDPFTVASDPRTRKHIRSFFAHDNVLQWQQPVKKNPLIKRTESALDALDDLDRAFMDNNEHARS